MQVKVTVEKAPKRAGATPLFRLSAAQKVRGVTPALRRSTVTSSSGVHTGSYPDRSFACHDVWSSDWRDSGIAMEAREFHRRDNRNRGNLFHGSIWHAEDSGQQKGSSSLARCLRVFK